MITQLDLDGMTHAQKDALILSLVARLDDALKRIAEFGAHIDVLTRPLKTPDNSSVPPSRGHKPGRAVQALLRKRRGRPGVARSLAANPDCVVEARLDACPSCQASFPATAQTLQGVYDRIELPPVRPCVTRVRLFGERCPCCRTHAMATAPAGLEPGSPFGRSVEAMVVYLHYAHAIGLERLRAVMAELLGLQIGHPRWTWAQMASRHRWLN